MPVQVPTIYKRERIPFEAIQDAVDQISAKFQSEKIILFGSYACGNPRPESDVDLLVVMPFNENSLRKSIEIF